MNIICKLMLAYCFTVVVLFNAPKAFSQEGPGVEEIVTFNELSQPNKLVVTAFGENVITFRLLNVDFANQMGAIMTDKGIVVIDTIDSPEVTSFVRTYIEQRFTRKDFAFLILTHNHLDHTVGSQVFEDIPIIAQSDAKRYFDWRLKNIEKILTNGEKWTRETIAGYQKELQEVEAGSLRERQIETTIKNHERNERQYQSNFHVVPPTIYFDDKMTLDMGNLSLKLYFLGYLHSTDNILIHIPEEGALFIGDSMHGDALNYGWYIKKKFGIKKAVEVLNGLLKDKAGVNYMVGGHASIWSGDKFENHARYVTQLWQELSEAYQNGARLDEIKKELTLEKRFPEMTSLPNLKGAPDAKEQHQGNMVSFWREIEREYKK